MIELEDHELLEDDQAAESDVFDDDVDTEVFERSECPAFRRESQYSISEWFDENHPSTGTMSLIARANKEIAKVFESLCDGEVSTYYEAEVADALISLYRLATALGVDVQGAVDRRMFGNRLIGEAVAATMVRVEGSESSTLDSGGDGRG